MDGHYDNRALAFIICIKCFCIGICISAKTRSDVCIGPNVLDLNILEALFVWILAMELLNHFSSIGRIGSRFPSPFTNFVILPMDKIFQFLSVDARIKDFGDF